MGISSFIWVAVALWLTKPAHGGDDTYTAVVVEYSPPQDPSIEPDENILNNVKTYIDYIDLASTKFYADIIVFPEDGLKGYGNQEQYLEVPDPANKLILCGHNTKYEAPLIQLSCKARATNTYIVVNLGEKFYHPTLQRTLYFNTDVVFDLYGAIIARYRKIHLFEEGEKSPPPEKELVYFDTEFGVRFGIFTCFDIIFEDPGVELARLYNISHFVFTTAWFSEMPFLTAIQEQWYFSYSLDVTLLAAGYNQPSVGSTGSGIYLGKRGPALYNMTETNGSFMLAAKIPKKNSAIGNAEAQTVNSRVPECEEEVLSIRKGSKLEGSTDGMKMKREQLEPYTTKLITMPSNVTPEKTGSNIIFSFPVEQELCQNLLCCKFSLKVKAVFSPTLPKITRGDDYSSLYYRLAVFDGVRAYDHAATGGVQTCAIIPCVNRDFASCAVRSDNITAVPNTFKDSFQTGFIFDSITITGNFSNNNSFVGPNILLQGEYESFGALLYPENFIVADINQTDTTTLKTLQMKLPIADLVTASLYGRLFNRDGPYVDPLAGSSTLDKCINVSLLITAFASLWFL